MKGCLKFNHALSPGQGVQRARALPLCRPLPMLRLLAPLALRSRPQVRLTPTSTANASPSAPKAQKLCTQLMSGIEHSPSLLGNFLTSEFRAFRCLFLGLSRLDVIAVWSIWRFIDPHPSPPSFLFFIQEPIRTQRNVPCHTPTNFQIQSLEDLENSF
jgi:hypothetical protein